MTEIKPGEEPKCEAVTGPDEVCPEIASWRREDGLLLCQAHNDYDLELNPEMVRRGVWEEFSDQLQEELRPREKHAPPSPDISLTVSDLAAAVIQKTNVTGIPEGLLVKICFVSLSRYLDAHDRWERLESDGHQKRAPLWLDRSEADKIVSMLAGQRGATARLIRQEIESLFNQ
jgi:hypothetical protein